MLLLSKDKPFKTTSVLKLENFVRILMFFFQVISFLFLATGKIFFVCVSLATHKAAV